MDETSNVNNLNGVPNFGHGMPEDGIVEAGITDIPLEEIVEAPISRKKALPIVEEVAEEPALEMPVEETGDNSLVE